MRTGEFVRCDQSGVGVLSVFSHEDVDVCEVTRHDVWLLATPARNPAVRRVEGGVYLCRDRVCAVFAVCVPVKVFGCHSSGKIPALFAAPFTGSTDSHTLHLCVERTCSVPAAACRLECSDSFEEPRKYTTKLRSSRGALAWHLLDFFVWFVAYSLEARGVQEVWGVQSWTGI